MKKLRTPDGERRGRFRRRCNNCQDKLSPLFWVRVSYSAIDKAAQEYLCFPCLETVERYVESNDTYTMEWREAGEDEYETVA